MTDVEWEMVMALWEAAWPDAHALPREAEVHWREVLDSLSVGEVLATLRSLEEDGERFRPNAGMVYHRALDYRERPPELMSFEEMNAAGLAEQERISGAGPEPLRVIVGAERLRLRAAEESS
ncbi:MAG: hypothetical protein ABSC16_14330 [Candidatus Dormibacteria bacterium]|nr:hypothetical protein [Chloroflexota bacterium]